ncbi:MAG TPA: helix-turn-helix transcriptional regulator [Candidatus Nitrosocosmicus sp.]|nr:helix-turn-helix transcriptional regulator [Candidatus Nitrosocosmicus sp.]
MIKIHLSRVLGERRITQAALAKKTGIRPTTINMYYHEYIKRMNVDDLDIMCKVLKCRLEDLLEFIPDEDEKK